MGELLMLEEVAVSKSLFSALSIKPPLWADMESIRLEWQVISQCSSKDNLGRRESSSGIWAVSVL